MYHISRNIYLAPEENNWQWIDICGFAFQLQVNIVPNKELVFNKDLSEKIHECQQEISLGCNEGNPVWFHDKIKFLPKKKYKLPLLTLPTTWQDKKQDRNSTYRCAFGGLRIYNL